MRKTRPKQPGKKIFFWPSFIRRMAHGAFINGGLPITVCYHRGGKDKEKSRKHENMVVFKYLETSIPSSATAHFTSTGSASINMLQDRFFGMGFLKRINRERSSYAWSHILVLLFIGANMITSLMYILKKEKNNERFSGFKILRILLNLKWEVLKKLPRS